MHWTAGILRHVALARAILRLLSEEKFGAQLCGNALATVKREHSVDRMTGDYLKLYRELLPGVRPVSPTGS